MFTSHLVWTFFNHSTQTSPMCAPPTSIMHSPLKSPTPAVVPRIHATIQYTHYHPRPLANANRHKRDPHNARAISGARALALSLGLASRVDPAPGPRRALQKSILDIQSSHVHDSGNDARLRSGEASRRALRASSDSSDKCLALFEKAVVTDVKSAVVRWMEVRCARDADGCVGEREDEEGGCTDAVCSSDAIQPRQQSCVDYESICCKPVSNSVSGNVSTLQIHHRYL